jgi:hypothetical protein
MRTQHNAFATRVVISPGPGWNVAEQRIIQERPRDVSCPEFNHTHRNRAA